MTVRLQPASLRAALYTLGRCWAGELSQSEAHLSCDRLVGLLGGRRRASSCKHPSAAAGLFSHVGPRSNNEDSGLAAVAPGRFVAVAVADGVGGLKYGEIASYRAICAVLRGLILAAGGAGWFSEEWFESIFDIAHEDVARSAQGGATTLVVSVYDLTSRALHVAHVGDSVAYVVLDRGAAEYQLLTQELDEASNADGPYITQALGHASYRRPHYYLYDLAGFSDYLKVLVAASDGVDDFINKELYGGLADLYRRKKSATELARTLVCSAVKGGGRDNATAAVAVIAPGS
jgi:serine/threonine protein phosphatase PrpC